MKTPGYFLLGMLVGGLLMAYLCRAPIDAANRRAEIDSQTLKLYVAFVGSEYDLPVCGACETLSRAQEKAWRRQKNWAELGSALDQPSGNRLEK